LKENIGKTDKNAYNNLGGTDIFDLYLPGGA